MDKVTGKEKVIEKVWYAMSADDYEDLSLNQAETFRWAKEARWRLEYYHGNGEGEDEDASAR